MRRDEYWKFTDPTGLTALPAPGAPLLAADEKPVFDGVDALRLVFVDGVFAPERSDAPATRRASRSQPLAEVLGTDIHWARELFGQLEARGQEPVDRPLAALNTARATEGVAIRVTGRAGEAGAPSSTCARSETLGRAGPPRDPARARRRPDAARERRRRRRG